MILERKYLIPFLAAVPLAVALPASAQQAIDRGPLGTGQTQTTEARDTLQEARNVVQTMQADPALRRQLQRAKGVFIVPNFARGGAGIVAKGGEGVLTSRLPNGSWSQPAFYNMGGVSVGLQAGASAGQIAFLLMSDRAAKVFDTPNTFSINANAGLAIVDWSARAQASAGKGDDVIAWSDTEGLFAGANIGVSDIVADNEENRAFYGPQADAQALLHGRVNADRPAARQLTQLLAANGGGNRGVDRGVSGGSGGQTIDRGTTTAGARDGSGVYAARADRN